MICFRFHRGGFDESMLTKRKFRSFDEFMIFLRKTFDLNPLCFEISLNGFDNRLMTYSFIVCADSFPIGFMWFDDN